MRPPAPIDEFETIARLFAPLTGGEPGAFGLMDDAAAIPSRPGHDLIVTKDAMVAGVHFLPDDPLDLVARKLLRVNLSDLAAKAAEPFAYLLAASWPAWCGWPEREAFARGLAEDQAAYGVRLLGGDTTSTPGPLTLSLTAFGWTPEGRMVRRASARPGDRLLVSGTIGDGFLGLKAARGELSGLDEAAVAWLADRYRLPSPRLELREALRGHAGAAADVSDGLVADADHIAEASGAGMTLDLGTLPLSAAASDWLARQLDRSTALTALATGGDDYEVVCTAPAASVLALMAEADQAGVALTEIGEVIEGRGVRVLFEGQDVTPRARTGWRHG